MRSSIASEFALGDEQATVAQAFDGRHVVADEGDGASAGPYITHLPQTLLLKASVADGEHFIDQQDFRLEKRSHREGESQIHAAGIAFYRRINKLFHFGKGDYIVELALNLGTAHAKNGSVEEDVFPTG